MAPRRKIDPLLKHRIVTFSGLGKLTQAEIAARISLPHTSPVALGLVSRRSISTVCAPYRQKKMEDEQLFSLRDVKAMTGIKRSGLIREVARKNNLGTQVAKFLMYKQADIDKIMELLEPPPGLSSGEVQKAFGVSETTLNRWRAYLDLKPTFWFGVNYYSPEQVKKIRRGVELGKLNLTVKKLAREAGVSKDTAFLFCKEKGFGRQRGLSLRVSKAWLLTQGEYSHALSALLIKASLHRGRLQSAALLSRQPA